MRPGEQVSVALEADPVEGDYVWRWRTKFPGKDAPQFEQSTFYGQPRSPGELRRRALDFSGTLNDEGRFLRDVLAALGRGERVEEIAVRLAAGEPRRFAGRAEARQYVAGIAAAYGE